MYRKGLQIVQHNQKNPESNKWLKTMENDVSTLKLYNVYK